MLNLQACKKRVLINTSYLIRWLYVLCVKSKSARSLLYSCEINVKDLRAQYFSPECGGVEVNVENSQWMSYSLCPLLPSEGTWRKCLIRNLREYWLYKAPGPAKCARAWRSHLTTVMSHIPHLVAIEPHWSVLLKKVILTCSEAWTPRGKLTEEWRTRRACHFKHFFGSVKNYTKIVSQKAERKLQQQKNVFLMVSHTEHQLLLHIFKVQGCFFVGYFSFYNTGLGKKKILVVVSLHSRQYIYVMIEYRG